MLIVCQVCGRDSRLSAGDHSIEGYLAIPSCGTVYYAVKCGSKFHVCG